VFCPECTIEYRDGFTRCSDCDVELVATLTEPEGEPDVELVKVYETANPAIVPFFESLLKQAGIEYLMNGAASRELFGWGRFGSRGSYAAGPVQFFVRQDAADDARAIVASLEEPETLPEDAVGDEQ
jgi:hypothetical protein